VGLCCIILGGGGVVEDGEILGCGDGVACCKGLATSGSDNVGRGGGSFCCIKLGGGGGGGGEGDVEVVG
jgi:hypothetical protein